MTSASSSHIGRGPDSSDAGRRDGATVAEPPAPSAMPSGTAAETFREVAHSVPKVDGEGLVCGQPMFCDDIDLRGLLIGKILPSPYAHARIVHIDTSAAEAMRGVKCVLTHKNVPRVPHTTAGQGYPEPSPYDTFMLDSKVRFVGDRVAAVAAVNEEIAMEALSRIKVDYEELPAVLDPREAMKPGAPVIHDEPDCFAKIPVPYDPQRNLAAHVKFQLGDVERALSQSAFIFDAEFETPYASHCAIEPHITICYIDEQGRLVVRTSTQVPFHARRIVAQCLQLPIRMVRVIKPRIGGGFGGKQEILLEDICGMLAWRTRRPVKMELTRAEEFIASRTRHPQVLRLRAGASADGTIKALDLSALMNTGAYGSHALTVLCNTGSKTLGLYHAETIRFEGHSVYTNLPVGGAYRGYGATQGFFALGVAMDAIAEFMGGDVLELHKRLHIQPGEVNPVTRALGEGREGVEEIIGSCGLDECIERGAAEIGWREKRGRGRLAPGPKKRGVGMVCLMQGSSIPEIDMASAAIKMNEDGSFNLTCGATDLGTGSDTVLAQIAAETLGVSTRDIIVYSSDTDMTPFDVGAYASSTTYLSGQAVERAARRVREQILRVAARMLNVEEERCELQVNRVVDRVTEKSVTLSEVALYSLYQHEQHQIAAVESAYSRKSPPPFAAHFCEVEVDVQTGLITVLKYVAACDCGVAINPRLAEGQVEGAVLNGISYALTEEYLFNSKGRMLNPNWNYYKLFSALDTPEIKTILVETYEDSGPYGAKSVSEININGPMGAISNAVFDATGVRLLRAPFTPERVLAALAEKQADEEKTA
ncbi:MAG: molybdopterin-dependent oxidoreductase [Candidatus Sumerlaeia bacterium]